MVLTSITDPPESSLPSPSSKDNDVANKNNNNNALPKRPKSRVVPSRYLSPSPSNPNSSPMHSMSNSGLSGSPLPSQSAGRRRPATPQAEMSAAAKLVITSSRSLSVSFQGEAFPLHVVSKAKPVSGNSDYDNVKSRKATPERRRVVVRDQGENSRPVDQHLWPGRTRRESDSSSSGLKDKRNENSLFRSLDCSNGLSDRKKLVGLGSGKSNVVKALQQSMIMDSNNKSSSNRRASFDGRLSLDLGNVGLLKRDAKNSGRSMSVNDSSVGGDVSGSETDSVSSGGNSGGLELGSGGGGSLKSKSDPRGIIASARFWQETNSRLRRLQDPGSPLTPNPASGSKFSQPKRLSTDSPISSSRTMASPIRGASSSRPVSPNRQWNSPGMSPSRGMSSPSRVRPSSGSMSSISSATASILSFSVGIRRGKVGEDHIFDAHTLRLLYNRYLQWRFINARAESTFEMQRIVAEKYLWNAWVTVSELRHSVTLRRMKLLLLRQKLKLASILNGQITFLEEWSILDRDHSSSLLGAIEALKASTLRLPLVGKATADIQNLKNAIGSALDVMKSMASSICSLSSKVDTDIHASVDEMNTLVSELVSVTAKEHLLLDQCRSSMSDLAVMQVKDYSLRTHVLQSDRIQTTQILTTHV